MIPTLNLSFLGPPQINLNDEPLSGLSTNKAQALLFYLAVTGETHTRHALATLLWSDATDRQARKNLRNVLYDLRPLVGPYLDITAQTVSFDRSSPYRLDVEIFTNALSDASADIALTRLDESIKLYRGEFLEGFHVRNTILFEEWVLLQREYLQGLFIKGLDTLARRAIEEQGYALGLTATERLLAVEPWRETTHRQRMLCLALTGQRNAALIQYETCRQILADELDTAPLAETTELYEQLKSGNISPPSPLPPVQEHSLITTASPAPSPLSETTRPLPLPQIDWGHAPIQTPFYGRQSELKHLAQWVVNDGCRLAAIFGIGGQGKTALTVQLTEALAYNKFPDGSSLQTGGFDRIIWRSLRNGPPFTHLLREWLQTLTGQSPASVPDYVDAQLALLFEQLQQQRCLLILDDFSGVLPDAEASGQFRPTDEAYEQLLVWIARTDHRSCLLLTSRLQPREFQHLALDSARVRSLPLTGLCPEVGQEILEAFGLTGSQEALSTLNRRYSGHPLALKLAAMTIQNFFGGNIDQFIQENILIFDGLQSMIEQQLAPLSPLEREIMTRLALEGKPVAFQTLSEYLAPSASKRDFLAALQSLQRRCLLEKYVDGFAIQNLLAETLATGFVETVCREIEEIVPEALFEESNRHRANPEKAKKSTGDLTTAFLNRYNLVNSKASPNDQPEHLLHPIAAHLAARWRPDDLQQHLNHLLTTVRDDAPQPDGYARVNLYHILNAVSRVGSPLH